PSPAPTPQSPQQVGGEPAAPPEKAKAEDAGGGEPEDNTAAELRTSRKGLGMDPGALNYGDLVLPPPPGSQYIGQIKANQLNFHGYLRAPMLVGLGSGSGIPAGVEGGLKLHSPPRIPDAAYTDWKYTNDLGGPWTELQFIYGNARVFATVQVASYNLTD